jgi:hypothetical protein
MLVFPHSWARTAFFKIVSACSEIRTELNDKRLLRVAPNMWTALLKKESVKESADRSRSLGSDSAISKSLRHLNRLQAV